MQGIAPVPDFAEALYIVLHIFAQALLDILEVSKRCLFGAGQEVSMELLLELLPCGDGPRREGGIPSERGSRQ